MISTPRSPYFRPTLVAVAVASVLLAACAAVPVKPAGADEARAQLTQLQSDPNLANRVPVAVKEAEVAVQLAEEPVIDPQLAMHRVYLAERKVETARAEAETRYAEDQRTALTAQRDQVLINARTREADVANSKVATARTDADIANINAANAQQQAANAQQQAADLQQQIALLQAKATDRGIVLTLGDVLFEVGKAELKSGADANLNKLVAFLNHYPDRTAKIEGYTDSTGSADFNLGLSQRRADAVRGYLVNQGVDSQRLSASGEGESSPVADNASAAGRQQNRRVEVVIANPSTLQ